MSRTMGAYQYKTPEDFAEVAEAYFEKCEQENRVATVNGLCLALDIVRDTLLEYAKHPGFETTVRKVRMRLESYWEQRLAGANAGGSIFWLKNQGWSDQQQFSLTGKDGGPIESRAEVMLRPQMTREEWLLAYVDSEGTIDVDPAAGPAAGGD